MTAPSKVYNTVVLSLSIEIEPVVLYTETQIDWESLVCLSTFDGTHMRRNTRLSPPAQLQCWHSGAGEPGVEAMKYVPIIVQAVHFIVHWLRNKANVVSQKNFNGQLCFELCTVL